MCGYRDCINIYLLNVLIKLIYNFAFGDVNQFCQISDVVLNYCMKNHDSMNDISDFTYRQGNK